MKATTEGDLVTAVGTGNMPGIEVPAALESVPTNRLRFVHNALVDVTGQTRFYIDPAGQKHIEQLDPSWPEVECGPDDVLSGSGTTWAKWNPVPKSISRHQLLIGMLRAGFITPEEATAAAATGTVPASLEPAFASLPAEEAVEARIAWATKPVIERNSRLLAAIMNEQEATDAEIDEFVRLAAAL
jgi:hypothetical protein